MMKSYVVQATLNQSVTSKEVKARDNFSAKVLAVQQININYAADKRWAKGTIVLKDDKGKIIWQLKEVGEKKE